MRYVYGVNVKFKKGDYVIVVDPNCFFRGLVLRVNRRRYSQYFLEITPDIDIPHDRLRMSKENISRSLKHRYFYEESLKPYNRNRLDGDKL